MPQKTNTDHHFSGTNINKKPITNNTDEIHIVFIPNTGMRE